MERYTVLSGQVVNGDIILTTHVQEGRRGKSEVTMTLHMQDWLKAELVQLLEKESSRDKLIEIGNTELKQIAKDFTKQYDQELNRIAKQLGLSEDELRGHWDG